MSPTYIAMLECPVCRRVVRPVFQHKYLPSAAGDAVAGEIEPWCCNKAWTIHAIQRLGESCPEKRTVNPDHYRGPLTRLARKVVQMFFGPCPRPPYDRQEVG